MATDSLFLKLKSQADLKGSLSEQITIRLTASEKEILSKKATALSMSNEDLLREYIVCETQAFNNGVSNSRSRSKSSPKSVSN